MSRKISSAFLRLFLLIILTACASTHTPIDDLRVGMTPGQVHKIMGEPDSTSVNAFQGNCWYYGSWHDRSYPRSERGAGWSYACFKNEQLDTVGSIVR